MNDTLKEGSTSLEKKHVGVENLIEESMSTVCGSGTLGYPLSQRDERGDREQVHQGV